MLVCGFVCFVNGSLSASYVYKHVMTSVAESVVNHQSEQSSCSNQIRSVTSIPVIMA